MDEIADAAKVSRRTLFRLFPSKAELVWEGLDRVLVGVKVHATSGQGRSLQEAMVALFSEGLRALESPAHAAIARRRLRIIAGAPALLGHPALARLEALLAQIVERHRESGSPPAALVARSLFGVGLAALFWWAESDGAMSPQAALSSALTALGALGGRQRRRGRSSG